MKRLLKSVVPKGIWEGARNFSVKARQLRSRYMHYQPWMRRAMMPPEYRRAARFADNLSVKDTREDIRKHQFTRNPLWDYAKDYSHGPGFWKWDHFYEIYHRHLNKFVGRPVNLCEIGVFSGGSLDMWASYFGSECQIFGIDLEPACKNYERSNVKILIGDQADVNFWTAFKQQVPVVDILIDDGGHTPNQQIVTLEQMLSHLSPGGVFICEDIYGINNRFASYVAALIDRLNAKDQRVDSIGVAPTSFQRICHSVHCYPYLLVIEKHAKPIVDLICPKRGTEWSPFYHQS